MHRFLCSAAALASALALGCAEHTLTAPMGDSQAFEPASGSLASAVERGTSEPVFGGFIDGRHLLWFGVTVEDLVGFICTGTDFDLDQFNQLLVTRPDGSTKLQLKGEANVVVVDRAAFTQSFCQDPSLVPTYTGTARLVVNDNDVDLSGPGADAAQVHLVGTVTDESGQRYHLVGFVQTVVGPEFTSPDDFEFRQFNVKIRLTPIGR